MYLGEPTRFLGRRIALLLLTRALTAKFTARFQLSMSKAKSSKSGNAETSDVDKDLGDPAMRGVP